MRPKVTEILVNTTFTHNKIYKTKMMTNEVEEF